MLDLLASLQGVIEAAKLDAYLALLQQQPDVLEFFRVLLENGCPPKAINAVIEHQIAKGPPSQNGNQEDGCL